MIETWRMDDGRVMSFCDKCGGFSIAPHMFMVKGHRCTDFIPLGEWFDFQIWDDDGDRLDYRRDRGFK